MMKQWVLLGAGLLAFNVACSNSNLLVDNSATRFCQAAVGYNQASTALDRLPPHATRDQLKAALDESLRDLRTLTKQALPGIKPDLQNVVDGYATLLNIVKKYGYDFAKIPPNDPDFLKFATSVKDIQKSGDLVTKYLSDTCGINGGIDTTTPSGVTSVQTSAAQSATS